MISIRTKINIARIVIGIVLIFGLIIWLLNFYKDISAFEMFYGKKLTFGLTIKLMYHARTFLNPFIILLAAVGFFISKPIGWVLTSSIFTYLLTFVCLIGLLTDNMDWYYYLTGLITIGLIGLMNQKGIIEFHKIKKINLLTLNLTAIVTGLVFTYLWGYFSLNTGENYLDIIYNK